ncbi:coiled-coil domain-containing protein [Aliikangiella coralliicola]|uniref:Uncharacterized protein n=1 Tax=Aliikangiella coralliicola TaxID=2592383 RepID=A0A545UIU8_9GAMM|nr:hypothetical protein [Aliikangiella coralliicola]TQV89390.1 hypothetical protein FLL46_00465 [Aliikangiella coralliicola]
MAKEITRKNQTVPPSSDLKNQIDPKNTVPEDLQDSDYESDIWSRIDATPVKPPFLKKEEFEKSPQRRELFRIILYATHEREKEILLHNQARVFSSILQSVSLSVGAFLNRPWTPKSWYQNEPKIIDESIGKNTVNEPRRNKPENEDVEREYSSFKKSNGLKLLIAGFLTPKYFLTAALSVLALATGYSQWKIMTLNDQISTYEQVLKTTKENSAALEARIKTIDLDIETRDRKLKKAQDELRISEEQNVKLRNTTETQLVQVNTQLARISELEEQLKQANTGLVATAKDLVNSLNGEKKTVSELRTQNEIFKRELELTKGSLDSQVKARIGMEGRVSDLQGTITSLNKDVADLQLKITKLNKDKNLLAFSESAISNIEYVATRWDPVASKDVLAHIKSYREKKERHR